MYNINTIVIIKVHDIHYLSAPTAFLFIV